MVERIKAIMAHYQLRAAQFSDNIGMQRSAVSHVLSGRNKPSLDFILRIKKYFPEINLDWLTMGEGDMFERKTSPSSLTQNLFSESPNVEDTAEVAKNKNNDVVSSGKTVNVASEMLLKNEEQAYYGVPKPEGRVTRVLFVYDDGTFSEYKPRK